MTHLDHSDHYANWRWLHESGAATICYNDSKLDCSDKDICISKRVVQGGDQEHSNTYGVNVSGCKLEFGLVTQWFSSKNIDSRTYLMDKDYPYKLFQLKSKDFTYTVCTSCETSKFCSVQ